MAHDSCIGDLLSSKDTMMCNTCILDMAGLENVHCLAPKSLET